MADHNKMKSRKDRIMDAALCIFAEKGFQNTTISEISKEAGVSEATIYEYFGTKEELLFAIPEKVSNESYEETVRALPFIKDVEGRVRACLLTYVRLYQSNPDYSALVLLQLMSNKRFRQTPAHAAIRRSSRALLNAINEGIEDGTFIPDANAYLIRSILLGAIEHLFIHWHMQGRPEKETSIMDMLDPLIRIVLDGIRVNKKASALTLRLDLEGARAIGGLLQ
jgi:TetR/AcrR family transcriptional regulator, fatty acid metabolism regulator protein